MMRRHKIGLIGAGNIGGELARLILHGQLGDVVLFDVPAKEAQVRGKALDLEQCGALGGQDVRVVGTSNWKDLNGAHVLVITAGLPRKPGQSREDLIVTNLPIIREVADRARDECPDAFVIVVSNPLDAMVSEFQRRSRFPHCRVVGMAGVLDSARFTLLVARALGCSIKDVRAMVLGGHGDDMVPLLSHSTVNGVPIRQLLSEPVLLDLVARTRQGGGELVQLLGTSAYYAPAASCLAIIESYLLDERRLLPCAAYVEGEYGISGLYLGVPVVIGTGGVERIVTLPLHPEEEAMLEHSAQSVRSMMDLVERLPG